MDPERPDISSHFDTLTMEPLTTTYEDSTPHTIPVVIVDTLDDCGSDPSQAGQRNPNTVTHWSRLPETFKLIVTGRDDRAPNSFRTSCKQIEFSTGEEGSMDAKQDVHRFLVVQRFTEIGSPSLTDWLGERVLDILTTRAAGLFI